MLFQQEIKLRIIDKNLLIQTIDKNVIWATKHYTLLYSNDQGENWKKKYVIKTNIIKKVACYFSLLKRLFRLGIHNILILKSGTIIAIADGIIFRAPKNKIITFEKIASIKYGTRPLRKGLTKDGDENLYYGEYWGNKKRKSVSIFRSIDDGKNWHTFYVFKEKSIRHIHLIQYDSYENCLWIATGDKDEECQIVRFNLKDKTISPIGRGEQMWRTVSLIFTEKFVYWGTDIPSGPNFIYRYHRQSQKTEKVFQSQNPFYYSTIIQNIIFWATTVEKNKKGDKKWARLFSSKNGTNWEQIACWKKDIWSPKFLQYGTIYFPYNSDYSTKLFFTPVALKNVDQQLLSCNIYK